MSAINCSIVIVTAWNGGAVRDSRPALFPPNDGEIVFQTGRVSLCKEVERHAAMQVKQHWMPCVLLFNNIPCFTPLMLINTFSEMLPANGLPFSSTRGVGFPRPHSLSTPTKTSIQASKIEIVVNIIRTILHTNDLFGGLDASARSVCLPHVNGYRVTIQRREEARHELRQRLPACLVLHQAAGEGTHDGEAGGLFLAD